MAKPIVMKADHVSEPLAQLCYPSWCKVVFQWKSSALAQLLLIQWDLCRRTSWWMMCQFNEGGKECSLDFPPVLGEPRNALISLKMLTVPIDPGPFEPYEIRCSVWLLTPIRKEPWEPLLGLLGLGRVEEQTSDLPLFREETELLEVIRISCELELCWCCITQTEERSRVIVLRRRMP